MNKLSINELVEQEKGPIWVLNTSNEIYKTGADVFVTFTVNGAANVVSIPRTWLPQELTQRLPRKIVLESPYFTDALNKGMLAAISAADAQKILAREGAQKERDRLKGIEDAIKAATAARGIGKNTTISTGDLERDEELAREAENERTPVKAKGIQNSPGKVNFGDDDEEEGAEIDAGFQAWVHKVNEMEDPVEALNEVKMRGSMEIAEAQFLMENTAHENVKTAVSKRLKKILAASE